MHIANHLNDPTLSTNTQYSTLPTSLEGNALKIWLVHDQSPSPVDSVPNISQGNPIMNLFVSFWQEYYI